MKKYILRVVIDSDINVNYSKGGESDVGLYVRPSIQHYIIKNDILVMDVFDVRVIASITANNASKRNYVNEESV